MTVAAVSGSAPGSANLVLSSVNEMRDTGVSRLVALTVYAVLDLDHPRFGLINIGAAYRPLTDLRTLMK